MRISWFSDFDLRGSGYANISIPMCNGLADKGHEIKAVGLGYNGEEHSNNFSIIPARSMSEGMTIVSNLTGLWNNDLIVVALDMPIQEQIIGSMQRGLERYIAICPLEAPPLLFSYAQFLASIGRPYIISQFGTDECLRMGVDKARYLPVGFDVNAWVAPTPEQKARFKENLGYEDKFVVLTVADNQERKNLSKALYMFQAFHKKYPNTLYVMVTRKQHYVGWRLDELIRQLGLVGSVITLDRGIPFTELWAVYAASDAFLLTSKAEGLGMPMLEAMAMRLACIGTNCTAIAENLADGRGLLIDVEFGKTLNEYTDPFGNQQRYFASTKHGAKLLEQAYTTDTSEMVEKAYQYVASRTWDKAVSSFDEDIINIVEDAENVKKAQEAAIKAEQERKQANSPERLDPILLPE